MKKQSLIFVLLCVAGITYAQPTRVDSVLQGLQQSRAGRVLDTTRYLAACELLKGTLLTDEDITRLDKEAKQFINGADEDLCQFVWLHTFYSLSASDKNKAIELGKQCINRLDGSATPNKKTLRSTFLVELRLPYRNDNDRIPEGIRFYSEKIAQYKQSRDSAGLADCHFVLFGFYRSIGLTDEALNYLKRSDTYIDTSVFYFYPGYLTIPGFSNWEILAVNLTNYSVLYADKGDFRKAAEYNPLSLYQNASVQYHASDICYSMISQAVTQLLNNRLDSVLILLRKADSMAVKMNMAEYPAKIQEVYARYYQQTGNVQQARVHLGNCRALLKTNAIPVHAAVGTINPDYYEALISVNEKKYEAAAAFLREDITWSAPYRAQLLKDYKLLGDVYTQTGSHALASEAYRSYIRLQDSLLTDQAKYRTLNFETEKLLSDNELAISKLESKSKLSVQSRNFTMGIAALLLVLAGSIYYRFRSKKKANEKLEKTLQELRATQSQLIQSEKMASLGELTAGIAHEIQNPLNFVNNFSEVNKELIEELRGERRKAEGERNPQLEDELLEDIAQNEDKIIHHGKRADAIVKGMLQHSRSSTGQKEPTDINALCDEYLRLAYHGLRAKDNTFNVKLETDFDPAVGKVAIVPQDIGRVMLNLINNALYAVNERGKLWHPSLPPSPKGELRTAPMQYEPVITVTTKRLGSPLGDGGRIEIRVADNGKGIPQKVIDKIFQPFFTTKPTGQGTGLGLSLSYDIVKAHGGEIKVETLSAEAAAQAGKEGEGTVFTIQLPIA